MNPYYSFGGVELYLGDSREILPTLNRRFEACVTDPPYGLAFMGAEWDHGVPAASTWRIILDSLLPGAHLFSFGGTRTFHRLASAIEDAGFEIRDCISWLYGQGFPKSLDVSKAIAKQRRDEVRHVCRFLRQAIDASGISVSEIAARFGFHSRMVDHWAERDSHSQPRLPTVAQWETLRGILGFGPELDAEVERLNARKGEPGDDWKTAPIIGEYEREAPGLAGVRYSVRDRFKRAPATSGAALWQGWGTALKPAWEPIIVAMRPLEGTFAENALRHGVAGLNIDGARIEGAKGDGVWGSSQATGRRTASTSGAATFRTEAREVSPGRVGRWPANVVLDEEAGALLDAQAGERGGGFGSRGRDPAGHGIYNGSFPRADRRRVGFGDSGGPSRFFYCAKASNRDRGHVRAGPLPLLGEDALEARNTHPTVKPVALMEWLIRLVQTPTGGTVLDPFAGSGTTLVAARRLGVNAVGIELEERHAEIAAERLRRFAA